MKKVEVKAASEGAFYYQDIRIGSLYECTDIMGILVRDWHRNQPILNELREEYSLLNNHELFVVLEVNEVNKDLYVVKVLTVKGTVGWLPPLCKQYPFPAKVL
jgi:hypothetical protein